MNPVTATARRALLWVGPVVLLLVLTQFVYPGSPGSSGRGTPAAILFTGLVLGLVNSLTAAGLILIYRSTRIINFAQTAIGVAGATLVFDMVQLTSIPFPIALVLGLLISGVVGMSFELALIRRFFGASRLVLTVATIAAASVIAAFAPSLVRLMPFIPYRSASVQQIVGSNSIREQLPLPGFSFPVGSLGEFGAPELFAIEATVICLLLLAAFFRFTRAGVAVRALAENSERASLLGISVGTVSMIVWVIAGVISGVSAVAAGAVLSPGAATGVAPALLLPALAAAVIARFRSLPLAVYSSVLLAVFTQATQWSRPEDSSLVNVVLFVAIGAGFLLHRTRGTRSEEGSGGVSWEAVEEPRPIPSQLSGIGSVRLMRGAAAASAVIVVLAYPFLVGTGATVLGGNVAITTIIILSLVILTGWSGQVSLGQFGFAAVGGAVAAAVSGRLGLNFLFGLLLAPIVAGAVATIVGIPALRIRGLFLAVISLAFGLAVPALLFDPRYFGSVVSADIERPRLFFIDFEDERSMYYLCVFCLVLVVVLVGNLRKTRLGRGLIATRDSENNVQAFGMDPVRLKLKAFAISGALAGFAGAILAYQGRGLNVSSFAAENGIAVFLYAVFGGVSAIPGALLGSTYYNLVSFLTISNPVLNLIFKSSGQLFVLVLLFVAPGGLISIVNGFRDAVLRIIAQRRHIVVPSLFADFDPEVLERRLVPLGPESTRGGLAALPSGDDYTLASELYIGGRVRTNGAVGTQPHEDDAEPALRGGSV